MDKINRSTARLKAKDDARMAELRNRKKEVASNLGSLQEE